MNEVMRKKRRQYLVDPSYQLQFTIRLFATVLVVVGLTAVLIVGAVFGFGWYQPGQGGQATFTVTAIAVAITLLVELLLAIPIAFYLGIRQSNRTVGPMHHIRRVLEAIGSGDVSQRAHLRKGDMLAELADAINRMAEALERRFSKSP